MPEVVDFMKGQGLLPFELSGVSRPAGTLVQVDLLFAREGSPLRPNHFTF